MIVSPFERNFRFIVKLKNIGSKKTTISFSNDSQTNADNKDWIIIFPSGRIYLEPNEEQEIVATLEPMFNNKAQDEIKYNFIFNVDAGKKNIPITLKTKKLDFNQLEKTPIDILVLDKNTGQKVTGATYYLTLPSGMDGLHDKLDYAKDRPMEGIKSSIIEKYMLDNNVQLSFSGNFLRIEKEGYKPVYLSDIKTDGLKKTVYMEQQTNYFEYKEIAKSKTEFSFWWIKPSADNKFFVTSPGIHAAPGENKIPPEVGIYLYDDKGQQLWRYPIKSTGYDGSDLCWGLDISANGQYVAAGCYDGNIYLLNQKGELLKKYPGGNMVDVVAFSPDSNYLAFGPAKDNKDVGVIEVKTTEYLWTTDVGDRARTLAFSPDSKLLAVGSPNGLLTMFNITGQKMWQKSNGGLVPFITQFSGDNKMLVVGGKGREIIAYEPISGQKIWDQIIDQTPWPGINNISHDGNFAFGTVGGLVWYLDNKGNPLWRYEYGNFGHNGAYLTKNGEYFLLGGGNPTLFDKNGAILWEMDPNIDREKLIRARKEDYVGAEVVWVSEDGSKMVLGMSDGTIKFLEGKQTTTNTKIVNPIVNLTAANQNNKQQLVIYLLSAFIFVTASSIIFILLRKKQNKKYFDNKTTNDIVDKNKDK